MPTIRQMPVMPATTPNSLRAVTASCRTSSTVSRKVKIGEVELRMVARPASTVFSRPRDQREGDDAVEAGLDQEAQPQPAVPRQRDAAQRASPASRIDPAIKVRAAIKVTGGIVSTPTLMKV